MPLFEPLYWRTLFEFGGRSLDFNLWGNFVVFPWDLQNNTVIFQRSPTTKLHVPFLVVEKSSGCVFDCTFLGGVLQGKVLGKPTCLFFFWGGGRGPPRLPRKTAQKNAWGGCVGFYPADGVGPLKATSRSRPKSVRHHCEGCCDDRCHDSPPSLP